MYEIINSVFSYLEQVNTISITIRILMAMICGGLIGAEREKAHRPAGLRTYMLVCMGSAMVMLTGQYMYDNFQAGDPARLGAQVVSGIGFLGAGSIIVSGNTKVKGLTTAAGLWASACIGLAIGIGFYIAGIIATMAVYIIMSRLKKFENQVFLNNNWLEVYIELESAISISSIVERLKLHNIIIEEIHVGKNSNGLQRGTMNLRSLQRQDKEDIIQLIDKIEGVIYAEYIL